MSSDESPSVHSEDEQSDSDAELMAAYRSGLLKGKLVDKTKIEPRKKAAVYNSQLLKTKLEYLEENILYRDEFVEYPVFTIPTDEARATSASEHAEKITNNLANDDFKRETTFAMEAKSVLLLTLPKLEKHSIPTSRPDDYYAEMAKSDKQMSKVKSKLIQKQEDQERRQKLRKLRDQRKMGKQVQLEVKRKRLEDKKEFTKKVKQAQKRKTGDALFDDDEGRAGKKAKINKKREYKNLKFNTHKQQKQGKSAKVPGFNKKMGPKFSGKGGGNTGKNKGGKNVRPGKFARQKAKSRS